LLDEHGEALYVDLKKHNQFDLVGFLRGDVPGSVRLILTMIRHLPEDSLYVATLRSAPAESNDVKAATKPDPEPDPVQENLMWTTDRMLMAQLINSVNMLVRYLPQWQEGKHPKMPIVGPAEWRGEGDKPKSKPLTVMDVINNVMGQKNG
jgi:hypothetical protein